jgi:hypothetical protein
MSISKITVNREYFDTSGRKVRILCNDRVGPYPVVGLLTDEWGEESIREYSETGVGSTPDIAPLAHQAEWTSSFPKEDGWYWWKEFCTESGARIVYAEGMRAWNPNDGCFEHHYRTFGDTNGGWCNRGIWFGPLRPPTSEE